MQADILDVRLLVSDRQTGHGYNFEIECQEIFLLNQIKIFGSSDVLATLERIFKHPLFQFQMFLFKKSCNDGRGFSLNREINLVSSF